MRTLTTPLLREGSAAEAELNPLQLDRIRERAASWVDDGLTNSLVLLVARHGVVALHEAYGKLTPEPDSPDLEVSSIFPVSSLCKPITATALLMLVEEGSVELNRNVVYYLPEMKGVGADDVLVRHLLTHTSGFSEDDFIAFQAEQFKHRIELPPLPENQHKSIHLSLHSRYGCPPSSPPDKVMMYCNHTYNLIVEIIRRVSGQAFAEFAQERIFTPLLMTDSSFLFEKHFRDRMVKRQPFENPFGADLNSEKYLDTPWGSGGLNASAIDIAKFGQLFLKGGSTEEHQLLSKVSVNAMTTNQVPPGVPEVDWRASPQGSYGFGWFVFGDHRFPMNGTLVPKGSYTHSGMGGVNFWVDPLNDIVGVIYSIFEFEEGKAPPDDPPKLTSAAFQDMATAAVI